MPVTDNRIDDYISASAVFAKPILMKLRQVVHKGCPDVVETMKWSFPHFQYKGCILCSMAAFKEHCSFGFWLAALMQDPDHILTVGERTSMGHLDKMKSLKDLPGEAVLKRYIQQAMQLIDAGAKQVKKPADPNPLDLKIPDYFIQALAKNKLANDRFNHFPYSHKKEYVSWITEAKTLATREKRMTTAIEWIAEGKGRNWKYEQH